MSETIVAVLDDSDSIDKVVTVANRLDLSTVLFKGPQQPATVIPRCDGAKLLVVDVDALGPGGMEFCHQIRLASEILIVALGDRQEDARAVMALKAGADCYLSKPVNPELFRAQLEALFRRAPRTSSQPESVTIRGLTLDFARKEVRVKGELIPVTPAEYRLLACLVGRPGKVVSSSDLLREMSGYDCSEQEAQEIVKVHVSRLRNKIDKDPTQPSYVLNVRGFGYMLERRSAPQF